MATASADTKVIEIAVPLKYFSNFWRTLEMPLINCKINLIVTWSTNCAIFNATGAGTLAITNTKLYVPPETLLTEDNAKPLLQLKSAFIDTINLSKYQSKITTYEQNQYLDYLIDPSFQIVNRFFILSFENNAVTTGHRGYSNLKIAVKDYIKSYGRYNKLFDQPIKYNLRTYETLEILQLIKVTIKQLVVYKFITISKRIIR